MSCTSAEAPWASFRGRSPRSPTRAALSTAGPESPSSFSILVMAVTAAYLAVAIPGQIGNLFGAVFTFYLVATAWATVRRGEASAGRFEVAADSLSHWHSPPFSWPHFPWGEEFDGEAPWPCFGRDRNPDGHRDARRWRRTSKVIPAPWHFRRAAHFPAFVANVHGAHFRHRLRLHHGLPRLLPGPMHVTPIFFVPMLVPLGLLICWMIRVAVHGLAQA